MHVIGASNDSVYKQIVILSTDELTLSLILPPVSLFNSQTDKKKRKENKKIFCTVNCKHKMHTLHTACDLQVRYL
jgi:hypothetical protein